MKNPKAISLLRKCQDKIGLLVYKLAYPILNRYFKSNPSVAYGFEYSLRRYREDLECIDNTNDWTEIKQKIEKVVDDRIESEKKKPFYTSSKKNFIKKFLNTFEEQLIEEQKECPENIDIQVSPMYKVEEMIELMQPLAKTNEQNAYQPK